MSEPSRPIWQSPFVWLPLSMLVGVYLLYHNHADNLGARLKQASAELKVAHRDLDEVDSRLDASAQALAAANRELASLRASHDARHADLLAEHAAATNALGEEHIAAVAALTATHEAQVGEGKQALAAANTRIADLEGDLEGAQVANADLTERLGAMAESGIRVEAQLAENEEIRRELEAKLAADDATIAELHARLNVANQDQAALRDKLHRASEMHDELAFLVQQDEAAIEELKRRLVLASQARDDLEAQIETRLGVDPDSIQELQNQVAGDAAAIDALKAERDDLLAERERLAAELAETRANTTAQADARLVAAEAELDEARAALAVAGERADAAVAAARDEAKEALAAEVADLEAKLADAEGEGERISSALEAQRRAHNEALAARHAEHQATLEAVADEATRVQDELTRTRAAMQARIEELGTALATAEAGHDEELGAYEQRLAAADQALQTVQERLAERTQALEARLAQTQASGAAADAIRAFYGRVADLGARFTAQGIQVVLSGDELRFPPGTAIMPASELPTLMGVAAVMGEHPALTARLEGHTDSSGNAELNRTLSEQRAIAVRDALIERGIDGARLSAVGLGADRPIASNISVEGRQQNRRVEVYLLEPEGNAQ